MSQLCVGDTICILVRQIFDGLTMLIAKLLEFQGHFVPPCFHIGRVSVRPRMSFLFCTFVYVQTWYIVYGPSLPYVCRVLKIRARRTPCSIKDIPEAVGDNRVYFAPFL